MLLTNIVLAGRSGTEVVTEQLADGLRRRGHRVLVFTPQIGALAEEMRARGHVVVDRPAALPLRPDVIHAHHTGPAMAALAAHPDVPALFVSTDATAPFDVVPPHPGIRRVFAVDERCRARLVAEGARPASVGLLPNAVDLGRIPPRAGPLPCRPARAVAVIKGGPASLPAIGAACAAAGITLEELGAGAGRVAATPEAAFAGADLVFAAGRSALEAAAAGAGVVVCDARGFAGFLTHARAQAWLPWNLGAGILSGQVTEGAIAAAIAEYSATEAEAVRLLVRAWHGLDALLDRIETIHAELVATTTPPDPAEAAAATGAFIAGWAANFDLNAPWRRLSVAVEGGGTEMAALETLSRRVADLTAALAAQGERQAAALAALQAEAAAGARAEAARSEAIMALIRGNPLYRARDAAAAIWRRAMPRAIRAPLHRWRTGRGG